MDEVVLNTCLEIERQLKDLEALGLEEILSSRTDDEKRVQILVQKTIQPLSPRIQSRILDEFFELGPLNSLINDNEVTEIMINGPHEIWTEKHGQISKYDDRFFSKVTYRNIIDRICTRANVNSTLEHPSCDGEFSNFRLSLVRENLTGSSVHLCLRRHQENPWTLKKFETLGWCKSNQLDSLNKILFDRKNFIIIGPTGSGKTSIANALLMETSLSERSIIIEDTSELKLPNSLSMKLLTRKDPHGVLPEIDQSDLIKRALRLRPDRIVMGEIRGSEAKDFLMALATGHEGSFATLHASDPHQALLRLEMLIQLGAPQWGLQAIRRLIQLSLHYILVVKRTHEGRRILGGIYKLTSLEETGFLVETVDC